MQLSVEHLDSEIRNMEGQMVRYSALLEQSRGALQVLKGMKAFMLQEKKENADEQTAA